MAPNSNLLLPNDLGLFVHDKLDLLSQQLAVSHDVRNLSDLVRALEARVHRQITGWGPLYRKWDLAGVALGGEPPPSLKPPS
eukprot:CAMPEP_0204279120 /NCGR_PEP_ID=MMETSP0468-20130131/34100_1 /ASSEMBLY_ACC=CAM_ASM_000383 /TAXON_ID=2969 /ORGANISM="Oxyrrhis marina" /LENGTH=81 /DNA_ID=CAMNT_0051256165 /DNA_START=211 /DNA_END=456 /DNA_ORIENTATION=-